MPGFADLRLKRVMGFINWKRGRERLNDMGMLARLVADLRAQRPDHVAVTGDLVNIGMPAEFHRAALWMKTLGDPADVSFVPGNHDAYVRAVMPLLEATFAPWTTGDAPRGEATYPYLRVRRRDRDHRPDLGRADRAADGDRQARQDGSSRRSPNCSPKPAPRAWRGWCSFTTRRSPGSRRRCAVFRTRRRSGASCATAAPRRSCTATPTSRPSARFPRAPRAPSAARFRCIGAPSAAARRPRPALSRRLSSGQARPRRRTLAGQRPRPRARAGKRGDRRTGGAAGLAPYAIGKPLGAPFVAPGGEPARPEPGETHDHRRPSSRSARHRWAIQVSDTARACRHLSAA